MTEIWALNEWENPPAALSVAVVRETDKMFYVEKRCKASGHRSQIAKNTSPALSEKSLWEYFVDDTSDIINRAEAELRKLKGQVTYARKRLKELT